MIIHFPGSISAKRINCFRDCQYFHYPERMSPVGRRPIIQGLDIMTQVIGRMTEVIGVGFSVQFRNPIAGGDSITVELEEDGELRAEGPRGDIVSREATAKIIREPVVLEERAHYPYAFKLRSTLDRFGHLFGVRMIRERLAYLLAIGSHSGALVHRFACFDDPRYSGIGEDRINEYFAEMRARRSFPLFLDISLRSTGAKVSPGDTVEFGTLFADDVGKGRYGTVSVFSRAGSRQLFRTEVRFMMLATDLINRRYSQPLVV